MRALIVVALAAWGSVAHAQEATCPPGAAERVASLLSADQPVDAHFLAETLALFCPADPAAPRLQVLDALALVSLDEDDRARERLEAIPDGSGEAPRAHVLLAWSYSRSNDRDAYARASAALPDPARARLGAFRAFRDEEAVA